MEGPHLKVIVCVYLQISGLYNFYTAPIMISLADLVKSVNILGSYLAFSLVKSVP